MSVDLESSHRALSSCSIDRLDAVLKSNVDFLSNDSTK